MAFPAGVTTRMVTLSAGVTMEGGDALSVTATVRSSRNLVWSTTGVPVRKVDKTYSNEDGLELEFPLPVTDQAGWMLNGELVDVTDGKQSHYYVIALEYYAGGKLVSTDSIGPIAVPTGDGSPVDADKLIPAPTPGGATIALPDVWTEAVELAQQAAAEAAAALVDSEAFVEGKVAGDIPNASTPIGAALSASFAPKVSIGQAQQITTNTALSVVEEASTAPPFGPLLAVGPNDVIVDPRRVYQEVDGFGAALSDAAAYVLTEHLSDGQRHDLLTEMFSPDEGNLRCVRIALGSPDFRYGDPYTYDDMPTGTVDPSLLEFSIAPDTVRILPVLREILAINPGVRVFASVWHPPSWMLIDPTKNYVPGPTPTSQIQEQYLEVYATYLVKALTAYQQHGVTIHALNYSNETPPIGSHFLNTPALHQTVIKSLGPKLRAAGFSTKLLIHDGGGFGIKETEIDPILVDPDTALWVDGIAAHGYAKSPLDFGDSLARDYPGLRWYATEWRTLTTENADKWMRNTAGGYITDSIEGGASAVIFWNLALDENGGPQDGVHPNRRGVVNIDSTTSVVTRNTEYRTMRHLSRFVHPGARRCDVSGLPTGDRYAYETPVTSMKRTALVNPDGTVTLLVYNGTGSTKTFQVIDARTSQAFPTTLAAGEVRTFVWGTSDQARPAGAPVALTPPTVTVTATGAKGTATLTWSAPTSGAPVTGYTVLRDGVHVGQAPASATTWTEYVAPGSHTYTLVTESTAGTSESSSTATVTAATSPAAPTGLTLSRSILPNGFTLTWTEGAENGAKATYTAGKATVSGAETPFAAVARGYRNCFDGSVPPGTTVYYKVTATNAAGSTDSDEISGAITGPIIDAITAAPPTPAGAALKVGTFQHTVGTGTDRYLLVAIGGPATNPLSDTELGSVTWGGTPMTFLGRASATDDSTDRAVEMWGLANPASGTQDIVMTPKKTPTQMYAYFFPVAISFVSVNQSTPARTPGTTTGTSSTTATVATTGGAANDLVVAAACVRSNNVVSPATGNGQVTAASLVRDPNDNVKFVVTLQPGSTGTANSGFTWSGAAVVSAMAVAIRV